MITSTWQHY